MGETIRWGILGSAKIARGQTIPAIREAGNAEVAAVASRSQERAQAFADELAIPTAYGSYEALLADPEIDVIYNALPVSLHAEWSIRCAEAGKACLCEKPLTATRAEAEAIREAFASRDLLCTEVGMYRYHPLTQRMQELVAGAIGELCALRATFFAPIPEDEGNIRWQADCGGGAIGDLGCYCVGIMRLLAGAEPEAVQAMADMRHGVDATMAGTLRFPGNVLGSFQCGMRAQFDCSYEVFGTGGRLRVDRGGMVAWPGEAFRIQQWIGEDVMEEETVPAANHYAHMVADIADALREGRQPLHRIDDAIANMAVLERCRAAAAA